MAQPAKSALSEQGVQSREASAGQDLGVGHSVLPGYVQDMAEASHVESVESSLLFYITLRLSRALTVTSNLLRSAIAGQRIHHSV